MPRLQVASVDNYSIGGPEVGLHIGTLATGTVTFPLQPSDADTVTINDGATAVTFEFESAGGVTGGNVSVTIGATAALTRDNLDAAIVASALTVTTADTTGGGDPQVTLTHTVRGVAGNAGTIVVAGGANVPTVTGMSGAANEDPLTHVAKFRVTHGGKVDFHFENQSDSQLSVSVHVSTDGLTYKLMTASNNLSAVTEQAIVARCSTGAVIALAQGVDNYLRVALTGGGRLECQLRKHAGLEIVKI